MHYGITFQIVFVAVMVHRSINDIGINAQVAHGKCFKHQPKGVEVINQIVRSDAQSGSGNGWIGEISGIGSADGGFASEVGIPGQRVLDDEYFFQRIDIGINGVFCQCVALVVLQIGKQCSQSSL